MGHSACSAVWERGKRGLDREEGGGNKRKKKNPPGLFCKWLAADRPDRKTSFLHLIWADHNESDTCFVLSICAVLHFVTEMGGFFFLFREITQQSVCFDGVASKLLSRLVPLPQQHRSGPSL